MPAIRPPIGEHDFAELARLSRALARYHGDAFEPDGGRLQSDYGRWYEALLAQTPEAGVIGFAAYYRFYATERAIRGIELQNLFVDEAGRRSGIGRALVVAVTRIAIADACAVLRIGVRKDNAPAITFYERLGAELIDRGRTWACRFDGEAMRRLVTP